MDPLHFLKEKEVHFDYLPRMEGKEEPEKLKKGVEVWCRGKSSLKWGEGVTDFFLFNFFQVLSFLHLKFTFSFAKLCYYELEEKLFSSATITLGKKIIQSCLKMNQKISHKLRLKLSLKIKIKIKTIWKGI